MKNNKFDLEDNYFYKDDYLKNSRSKNAHKARRQIELELDRKRFKKVYEEVKDIDWELYE